MKVFVFRKIVIAQWLQHQQYQQLWTAPGEPSIVADIVGDITIIPLLVCLRSSLDSVAILEPLTSEILWIGT